jgi:O-antigen/teichoic acid export membrane protein
MAKATRLLFIFWLPLMWSLNSWALPAIQAAKDEGMRLYGLLIGLLLHPLQRRPLTLADEPEC